MSKWKNVKLYAGTASSFNLGAAVKNVAEVDKKYSTGPKTTKPTK